MTASKKSRPDKGASIISFPKCYTIIDLETTGLSPECNHIIEIGAIQVEDGEKIKGSHWHIYTEEYGELKAYPASDITSDDFVDNTIAFLDRFNVIEKPTIQDQLEML